MVEFKVLSEFGIRKTVKGNTNKARKWDDRLLVAESLRQTIEVKKSRAREFLFEEDGHDFIDTMVWEAARQALTHAVYYDTPQCALFDGHTMLFMLICSSGGSTVRGGKSVDVSNVHAERNATMHAFNGTAPRTLMHLQ